MCKYPVGDGAKRTRGFAPGAEDGGEPGVDDGDMSDIENLMVWFPGKQRQAIGPALLKALTGEFQVKVLILPSVGRPISELLSRLGTERIEDQEREMATISP
jgi:hypothetical protein